MRLNSVVVLCLLLTVASCSANSEPQRWTENTLAESYCDKPWPPTPVVGAAYWQKPTRPVVLISGIAGSMIHTPQKSSPSGFKKLWIAFTEQNHVALRYMSGIFNGSMVVERYDHEIVAREDGHGLCSIDDLDPDLVINEADSYYWHYMILYLISIGYVPGETLFGFPFDWRQSVRHPPMQERLHKLIHTIRENTPGKPQVDLMTHSMGGLVAKAYVSRYMEDAVGTLGKWIAIGTPWKGGGSLAYKAMISGYNLDMTTIPIFLWGLSEEVAHAVELNWPSAFELMPDVDHDPWWRAGNLSAPPRISYQVIGQDPAVIETSRDVKTLLQSVNADNTQVFAPGTPAVLNPISMGAWEHSDRTREEFAALTERLRTLRREKGDSVTLEITSIEGSTIPTRYGIGFPKAVRRTRDLQTEKPQYLEVDGDGTVPYASSLSDGLDATHFEYRGKNDHQRLLRTPEIFLGARHALKQTCRIEGIWKVDIYAPSGPIFSTQYWQFGDESAIIVGDKVLTRELDMFVAELPDGTPISGTLDKSCMTFAGTWFVTYRAAGTRILGGQCRDPSAFKTYPVPNGHRKSQCVYGSWSNTTTLHCDEGYFATGNECQKKVVPPPPSSPGNNTRTIIIVVCAIVAAILLLLVVGFFVYRMVRKRKDTPYQRLTINDSMDASVLAEDPLV